MRHLRDVYREMIYYDPKNKKLTRDTCTIETTDATVALIDSTR